MEEKSVISEKTPLQDHTSVFHRLFKIRYVFAVLGFILTAIVYGLKVNLSVAIVGMRNHSAHGSSQLNITHSDCVGDVEDHTTRKDGPFDWEEGTVGFILSSYFIGYLVSQVPGGRAAEVLSAKWILFASVALNIIPTLLTPPAAKIHWSALVLLRIIEGVGGGFSFPALHVMISKWAPVPERSIMSSVVYAGSAIGTVLSLLFSGLIVQHVSWEAVFYIMGSLSCIWCVLWWVIMSDSPSDNKFISTEERDYILSSLGDHKEGAETKVPIPWKRIWTSPAFLSILLAHTFGNCGWYMLLIDTPIYYSQVLKLSMSKITMASSIPFFTLWILSLSLSTFQSTAIKRKCITVTTARKIATLCASAVPAACLVLMTLVKCDQMLIFLLLGVATTCMGGMFSGYLSNHIDIAPRFAGTLMGLTNTVATIPGIVVPIIIGQATKTNHTREQWSVIFCGAAAFLAVEAVVYSIWGSGEEQPWNNPQKKGDDKESGDQDTKM
ncbi:sialin-like isoform X2 [Periplaneta americana]|uniref:sialin-like isoform X2 n=1 Tax=Periplaneta americana TaxID=6978 RepID=UPI0037E777C4